MENQKRKFARVFPQRKYLRLNWGKRKFFPGCQVPKIFQGNRFSLPVLFGLHSQITLASLFYSFCSFAFRFSSSLPVHADKQTGEKSEKQTSHRTNQLQVPWVKTPNRLVLLLIRKNRKNQAKLNNELWNEKTNPAASAALK